MAKQKGTFAKKSLTGTRNKTIKFRCTENAFYVINKAAELEGRSTADFLHDAVKKYIHNLDNFPGITHEQLNNLLPKAY